MKIATKNHKDALKVVTVGYGVTGRFSIESAPVPNAQLRCFDGFYEVDRFYTAIDNDGNILGFGKRIDFALNLIDKAEQTYLSESE